MLGQYRISFGSSKRTGTTASVMPVPEVGDEKPLISLYLFRPHIVAQSATAAIIQVMTQYLICRYARQAVVDTTEDGVMVVSLSMSYSTIADLSLGDGPIILSVT